MLDRLGKMAVRCEECDGLCELEDPQEAGGVVARCLHCGHRFDVSRGPYDRWIVVTPTGEELVFGTLRELKGAIDERVGATLDPPHVGGATDPSLRSRVPSAPPPLPRDFAPRRSSSMPPRRVLPSVPPASLEGTPAPSQSYIVPLSPSEAPEGYEGAYDTDPMRAPTPRARSLRTPTPGRSTPPFSPIARSSSLPPATRPVRRAEAGAPDMSEAMRLANRMASQPPRARSLRPPMRDGIGWGLPLALVAVLGAVGYGLYAADAGNHPSTPAPAASASSTAPAPGRVEQLLLDGELALSEGNLEGATEAFAKASALVDGKSARVALDQARLAVVRADIAWLRIRALPADAADDIRATRQSLSELTYKAREAIEAALALSPNDPPTLRAKIDALRISGEVEVARGLVPRVVAALAAEPETAYVLAALDLAQPGAVPPAVIDRLHIASLGEGGLGRARALLVYALARAGDVAGAQRELAALQAASRPHPATSLLASLVASTKPASAAKPETPAPKPETPKPESAPQVAAAAGVAGAAASNDSKLAGSPQDLLHKANEARRSGDYAKARGLYVATLSRNPGDSEALSGLGDTARAEGDRAGAMSFYKSAIAINPNYLPSQLALADLLWESGDRVEAQKHYEDISRRFSPTLLPERVRQRAGL
jgi:tetratricopeptide (TPR) repeat protein